MAGAWSVGAPVRPTLPAPARQLTPPPADGPQLIRCPQCHASEGVKVRTSKAAVSFLVCPHCGHDWKDPRKLVRVLVATLEPMP